MRVKIFGAGSIGNHLANASRRLGWDVVVCDLDPQALERMRTQIYPGRYGVWDEKISLASNTAAPKGGFDLIFIGTPPDSHLPLALAALDERPKAILVEKPVCPPSLVDANRLMKKMGETGTRVFVGYDHVVGKSVRRVEELVRERAVGEIVTIDVEFREHWEGIFKAHPWLSGPHETYLGYWGRGGGASGEHSHALNLWQHFAHQVGFGRVVDCDARVTYRQEGAALYDTMTAWNLATEKGVTGRVVQDVLTRPSRKRAFLQGTEGCIEWVCGYDSSGDAVIMHRPGRQSEIQTIAKTRPDDFLEELRHVEEYIDKPDGTSPIDIRRGLDTALLVTAAHESQKRQRRVTLNWDKGYEIEAIQ